MSTLSLLSIPRELIYAIAAVDAGVYNVLLRTCKYISSLFPLSTRLDFMVDFGVTVELNHRVSNHNTINIIWFWQGIAHDIFGPAIVWTDNDISRRWRGGIHCANSPAVLSPSVMVWYYESFCHRTRGDPAGTQVEWLRGASSIVMLDNNNRAMISWYTHGRCTSSITIDDQPRLIEAQAEIDYWLAR
jgi:hypothetical protein